MLAEMEAQAAREGIPIVVAETGALLYVLALARQARRIVEVGTAIGVSTLYLARALPADGSIVSFEIDEVRHAAARGYLERAGVLDRADLRLEDARAGLAALDEPFDMAFIDGVKTQYGDYLELLVPLLGQRALLAVDNVLMSGTVAEGRSDYLKIRNAWQELERVAIGVNSHLLERRLADAQRTELLCALSAARDGEGITLPE